MKNLTDAIREYYRFNKMGKNDFTYRKYFEPLFKDKDLKDITKEDIANARAGISGSPGTVNRYLSFFRAVLMYAYEELGWLPTKPIVKRVKEDPRSHKYFSHKQIKRLISVLPVHLKKPFIFSLLTGVRMGNCFNLKWDHIKYYCYSIWFSDQSTNGHESNNICINDLCNNCCCSYWNFCSNNSRSFWDRSCNCNWAIHNYR